VTSKDNGERDRARARRRASLLDAADRAVRSHGPDVSMDAVASEAGITKPVLYRHFGDRGGLFSAVAARHAQRLVDELRSALAAEDHPRERIRTTMDTYLGFLERDPELHRFATRVVRAERATGPSAGPGPCDGPDGPAGPAAPERTPMDDALGAVCEQVTAAVRRELAGAGLDPAPARTWGEGMVGMVQLVGTRWLDDGERPSREELVQRLTDLLWSGLHGIVRRDAAAS
jgi:AcrR family transcriptional regulator